MKKSFMRMLSGLLVLTFLTGCLHLQVGGGKKTESQKPTIGQQLVDLQRAKDSGAITDTEYQVQKGKLLDSK